MFFLQNNWNSVFPDNWKVLIQISTAVKINLFWFNENMGEFDQHDFEYCGIDTSIVNSLPDVTKKN